MFPGGTGCPAVQNARKRATVTSYASSVKVLTVIVPAAGVSLGAVGSPPIVKVPPVIATRPHPATPGVGQLR